jgi:shikimate dehydrogenase
MRIEHLLGIIGWPVKHSLSPKMQNEALKYCGLNSWHYVPLPVEPARVKDAVMGLSALSFRGVNVTVPHKEAVLPLMNRLSDDASAIGAVNTIVVEENALLVGHNTDAQGFINDLGARGIEPKELSVAILGAGGSARAVVYGLLKHGCQKLAIYNRHEDRAIELIKSLKGYFIGADLSYGSLDILKEATHADLIINCTSLGMNESNDMPFKINFNKKQIVYDLIYNPAKTALLKQAEAQGATAINGLGMLIHQGALSFSLWTKREAPLELMKASLKPQRTYMA